MSIVFEVILGAALVAHIVASVIYTYRLENAIRRAFSLVATDVQGVIDLMQELGEKVNGNYINAGTYAPPAPDARVFIPQLDAVAYPYQQVQVDTSDNIVRNG
jgi:hypothetical protein